MSEAELSFDWPVWGDDALRTFLLNAFGVSIPDKRVCPGHVSPWEAFSDAYHARNPVSVWLGSRGFGGKTFAAGTLGLVEALGLGAEVKVLGGSGEQSQRVLKIQEALWQHPNAPTHLLASEPGLRLTKTKTGGSIQALFASSRSARGAHPTRLRMDEIDEMDLKILDAAMGQPQANPLKPWITPQVVLSSTHHRQDGTMTEILRRAKEQDWPVMVWCFKETMEPHGWLTTSQVERTKRSVTQTMWETEYELQEPSVEGRAIDREAVDFMFDPALGEYAGNVGQLVLQGSLHGSRLVGDTYVHAHGADWAKVRDWSIFMTLRVDTRPLQLCAFQRLGRIPYPEMARAFDNLITRAPGKACHDKTGVGVAVHDVLASAVQGVTLSGKVRNELLSDYIVAIENREIKGPRIAYAYHEHKFATREELFGHGHPPDSIVAGALAYKAARQMIGSGYTADLSINEEIAKPGGTRKSVPLPLTTNDDDYDTDDRVTFKRHGRIGW